MTTYGILVDYEYCTNCGSCQVSCKEEHGYPVGKTGVKVFSDQWKIDEENYNFNNYPIFTDLCDMCTERVSKGKEPICVHHCLAAILQYGPIEELAKKMESKPKQFLITPQYLPKQARGKFVHKHNATDDHQAAHMDVQGTGEASFGAHRADAKVGDYEAEANA